MSFDTCTYQSICVGFCSAHCRQAEQAIQQDAALAQMQTKLFHCSVQQSCVFEGQDHQSTILPTHPLPPWRWPVLRARFHPTVCLKHCMQSNIIWHGLCLLCFTAVCMLQDGYCLTLEKTNKKLIILCLMYRLFAVSFPQSPPFAANSLYTGQTHILEHTIFPLQAWPFSCGLFNLSKNWYSSRKRN